MLGTRTKYIDNKNTWPYMFLIGSPDITIEKAVSSAEESRTNSKCYSIIYQALRIICTNYLGHFETKRQSRLNLHVHI